jgi:hypothetical protein
VADLQLRGKRFAALRIRRVSLCLACLAFTLTALAEKVRLSECPAPVRATIEQNLLGGKVDGIKAIRINDHVLYLVEIDLKGFREAKLYISGDGNLRKIIEEIRLRDLPEPVRQAVEQQVKRRAQIEDIEKETIEGRVRYRIEIDPPKQKDRTVVFEANGSISFDK